MSGGDLSVRIAPRGRDELAQLVATFNEMAA
jgi:methyl-accepting chemotaxis protein